MKSRIVLKILCPGDSHMFHIWMGNIEDNVRFLWDYYGRNAKQKGFTSRHPLSPDLS